MDLKHLERKPLPQYINYCSVYNTKIFLRFFRCSRLALRNHTGDIQKTNFVADVSLVRHNSLLQITAISSDGKSTSTTDSKKQKNGSLPANPVNDRRVANAVMLRSTFRLP